MLVSAERAFKPRYIRGGSMSTVLQNMFSGDRFAGTAKELGKALYSTGKKFVKPIIHTGIEALKPVLHETKDELMRQLASKKDDLIKIGLETVQQQGEKLGRDLVNARNKQDLKNIIRAQEQDFKQAGNKINDQILRGAKSESEKTILKAVRDLPTTVGNPVFDKTKEQLSGIISEASKAIQPKVDTSSLVANLISGNGQVKKRSKRNGKGLYLTGQHGQGLILL